MLEAALIYSPIFFPLLHLGFISWLCQLIALWATFQNGNSVTALAQWKVSLTRDNNDLRSLHSSLVLQLVSLWQSHPSYWSILGQPVWWLLRLFLSLNEPTFSKYITWKEEKLVICVDTNASLQPITAHFRVRTTCIFAICLGYCHLSCCFVKVQEIPSSSSLTSRWFKWLLGNICNIMGGHWLVSQCEVWFWSSLMAQQLWGPGKGSWKVALNMYMWL